MTMPVPRRRTMARPVAVGLLALVAGAATAHAQGAAVLERNLPPPVLGGGGLAISPERLGASTDTTPLGVDVGGIRLIGPKEQPAARPPAGVSIGAIGAMPHAPLAQALAPFVGRPLSAKLIGDVQAAIAKAYRDAGYPFVAVTVPPQEVTSGVLQLQVSEFRYGAVTTTGAVPGSEAYLIARVRAQAGARIKAELLEEDLDWLNRYPYRAVQGVFAPGDALGTSALTLEITPRKPWEAFAGWSNTGTAATSYQRYFAGFGAAVPLLGDSFLSYQATGSGDFWSDTASVGTGPAAPNYFSQAGRLVVPIGARQSLEIAPNYVATRQNGDPEIFAFTNQTFELPVVYRTALSNVVPDSYLGDLMVGAVGRHVSRSSYFDGTGIGGAEADQFELLLGWAASRADAYGRTSVQARLVVNPGGVLGGNDAAHWSDYTAGRVDNVRYAYGTLDAGRVTRLPFGFAYVTQFSGLLADQALPDTDQLAIGGMMATRGYVLDDASVDSGFYWRNELRLPSAALLGHLGALKGVQDELSPYAFLDIGYGYNYGYDGVLGPVSALTTRMAGIGAGLDYRLGAQIQASFVAGYALSSAGQTAAGDWTLQGRLFVSY
jgi:hemolysin activation/secretion protein